SNRFSDLINIAKPFYKTPSHALLIGIVSGIKRRRPNPHAQAKRTIPVVLPLFQSDDIHWRT
ncbi:hypothetical protein PXC01_18335, partial [Maribacter sp. M208]|nr:hypothetical protein [Maribacter huludaoensis]